jgi:hypothetical protein
MDYKRNRRYFESINWIFVGFIIVFTALLLYFFLLIGIAILLGVAVYIYFKLKDRPTDEEIDDVFKEHAHTVLKKGYTKLGIDTDETKLVEPMMFYGPSLKQISYDPAVKMGKDQQVRSSNYEGMIFFFLEDHISFYYQSFSVIDDERNEVVGEYLYQDIMAISTAVTTTMYFDREKKRDQFFKLEVLQLIIAGSTNIECSVQDLQAVQDKIIQMKRTIQRKKSALL